MEGLKPMVDKAMGDQDGPYVPQGNPFQPLSGYAAVTPDTNVALAVNGHDVHVTVMRSLRGLAYDIQSSMAPEYIAMLVRLLTPVSAYGKASNDLPDIFWSAIECDQKIKAIKELRAASTLSLRSSKDIVEAIMDKPKDEDKSDDKDKDDSDKDESDKDKSKDKGDPEDRDQDDAGDDSGESDTGDGDDGEFDPSGEPDGSDTGELGGDQEVSAAEAGATEDAPEGMDTATAEALAALAAKAHDNGKNYSEDEIKEALKTLGIQF